MQRFSEFQMGIESVTSLSSVGRSNHLATRTQTMCSASTIVFDAILSCKHQVEWKLTIHPLRSNQYYIIHARNHLFQGHSISMFVLCIGHAEFNNYYCLLSFRCFSSYVYFFFISFDLYALLKVVQSPKPRLNYESRLLCFDGKIILYKLKVISDAICINCT